MLLVSSKPITLKSSLIWYIRCIYKRMRDQWDSSVRMFEIMPARESSEKPIIISSDQNFFRCVLAVAAEERLLRVRATNCTSFSWFFMCCRMPMMAQSRVSFLRSSSRDCELISVTKASTQNTCSLISMPTSGAIITRSRARTFWVTAGAKVSSLSSISPLSNQTDPSTSYSLSSRMAALISLSICAQSQPTFTSPFIISTMFLEHSLSKPVLNMLTSNWKTEVPSMNFKLTGFIVKFLRMRVTVLKSQRSCGFLGGQMEWVQLARAVNIFSWFQKRNGWWLLTLYSISMFREYTTSRRGMRESNPRTTRLVSALLMPSLLFFRKNCFLVCSYSYRVRAIQFCRLVYSSFFGF